MVVDWLKLDFIRQFFSLLAEDSANDKRRLKFWERHHKSIDDMYFALGSHARNNQSRDFIGLRKKMAGRVLDLNAGGSPRNNAFIMRMGDYIAVEFGVSGNACFIFERRDLPFDLEQKAINGDRSALKHENHVERLLHIDTGMARWEQTFEQELRGLINVRPDEAVARTSSSETKPHGTRHGTAAANRRASYSRKELERFCTTRSLVLHDFSAQRGNIWVRADHSDVSVNRQLSEWGFQYRPGKGWWREAP